MDFELLGNSPNGGQDNNNVVHHNFPDNEHGNNTTEQENLLMRASASGEAEIICEMWWSYGRSCMWNVLQSVRDEDGMTPLHRAVIAGHKEVVNALLSGGSDRSGSSIYFNFLHARTPKGRTAIHLAVFSENEAILEVLISKYDSFPKPPAVEWDFADLYWMTPLHYAILASKVAHMKQLLEWSCYDPHVNGRDYFRRTPLHLASCHRPVSVEALLQRATVDINAKDSFLQTPFHWAVSFGRVDVVRCLVRILLDGTGRTVQITDRDFEGRSVLGITIQDSLLDPIPIVVEGLPSVPAQQ